MQNHDFVELVYSLRSLSAETNFCEFKQSFLDPEKLGTVVSAISNAAALAGERNGYVVWGIEDGTHKLVGTTFNIQKTVSSGNQPLELWLAQNTQPALNFSFKEGLVEGQRVIILIIPAANGISTKFKHISYIRIGSTTPKLSDYPDREAALMSVLKPFIWENGISAESIDVREILSLLDIKSFFRLLKHPEPQDIEQIIGTLIMHGVIVQVVGNRFAITNMGAILFANDIELFGSVSRKTVRVVKYDGRSKSTTIKDLAGRKGYASGFNGLIKYITESLPQKETIVGGLRTTVTAYPELMIRESVANALVHQDFSISGCGPMVEIYKDRIEIVNPGKPLIEPSRFIDMPPRSRNELMAAMMRRLYICEERGVGVDRIVMEAESNILPAPDFRVDGDNHKAFLYSPRPFRDTTPTERVRACYQHTVMCFLRGDRMTNATLRLRLGIEDRNAAQVSRVINEAVDLGHIKQSDSWSARAGSYVPIWA